MATEIYDDIKASQNVTCKNDGKAVAFDAFHTENVLQINSLMNSLMKIITNVIKEILLSKVAWDNWKATMIFDTIFCNLKFIECYLIGAHF